MKQDVEIPVGRAPSPCARRARWAVAVLACGLMAAAVDAVPGQEPDAADPSAGAGAPAASGQEPERAGSGGPGRTVEATVGMWVRFEEVPVRGPRLVAKEVEDAQAADAIVRIANTYPHGQGAWRYNIEVQPLVAGTLDVHRFLERGDGSPLGGDVPPLTVEVAALLPEDRMEPGDLVAPDSGPVGGYWTMVVVAAIAWLFGLVGILFVGRGRKHTEVGAQESSEPTFADLLRPLVEGARDGTLDETGRARLERLLLAHWRREKGLEGVPFAEAVRRLRRDDEAGPLFRKLEEWLHRPAGASDPVDVSALLEPYRDVSQRSALQAEAAS